MDKFGALLRERRAILAANGKGAYAVAALVGKSAEFATLESMRTFTNLAGHTFGALERVTRRMANFAPVDVWELSLVLPETFGANVLARVDSGAWVAAFGAAFDVDAVRANVRAEGGANVLARLPEFVRGVPPACGPMLVRRVDPVRRLLLQSGGPFPRMEEGAPAYEIWGYVWGQGKNGRWVKSHTVQSQYTAAAVLWFGEHNAEKWVTL